VGATQPPIPWVPEVLYSGVNWSIPEADHSPLSSADVKNEWRYTSTSSIRFYGVHRDNFSFYCTSLFRAFFTSFLLLSLCSGVYLLHRQYIYCTSSISIAQAVYLLHRQYIYCTGSISITQAVYLLHRQYIYCTSSISIAQAVFHSAWRIRLILGLSGQNFLP
jgi:hypothetical protein